MPAASRFARFLPLWIVAAFLAGCSAKTPMVSVPAAPAPAPAVPTTLFPIMLGIDVLEADGFAPLQGKRVGLLSHPAGVNRRGQSTVDVLRRAPGVQLVALFGPEHGIYGQTEAGKSVPDGTDPRTGLPAYSLYGSNREPTRAQLRNIDVFVIDLQDIGVRSYTYAVCMKYAIEGCFKLGVPVMVLDRPNPLGGLKVDGPSLDANLKSGVGQFRVPYVHGLTIGELARMAYQAPGVLDIPDAVRTAGKLTIVPMRGWKRSMRWPDTGLRFVPTSPKITDFDAVIGYAMVGLGATPWYKGPGFGSGIGPLYFHRAIAFTGRNVDVLLQDLNALRVPGVAFRKVSGTGADGRPATGVYVDVVDWEAWRPTELSFHLLRLAARLRGNNPFATMTPDEALYFNKHAGSIEWFNAIKRDGARVNVEAFVAEWQSRNAIYRAQTQRYWIYE